MGDDPASAAARTVWRWKKLKLSFDFSRLTWIGRPGIRQICLRPPGMTVRSNAMAGKPHFETDLNLSFADHELLASGYCRHFFLHSNQYDLDRTCSEGSGAAAACVGMTPTQLSAALGVRFRVASIRRYAYNLIAYDIKTVWMRLASGSPAEVLSRRHRLLRRGR
jgi:hypothetical protein